MQQKNGSYKLNEKSTKLWLQIVTENDNLFSANLPSNIKIK